MPELSQRSLDNLSSAHPALQQIFLEAIKIIDFSVIEGHRGASEQNAAFRSGRSHVEFPHSKHNKTPSLAVDVAPYPIDWEDLERFVYLAGVVRAIAHQMGHEIRWGGDWDRDDRMSDERFRDYVHFEVVT